MKCDSVKSTDWTKENIINQKVYISLKAGFIATAIMTLLIFLAPMIGAGFFSMHTQAPVLMIMGSLMGHLVYGSVLGFSAK